MTSRRLALLAVATLLAASAAAQEPVLGSLAITWDEIMALPTGTSGRSRQLVRLPTATLDELEMHITWLPVGQTTHAPHTHPNEEVIVIREGTLEAFLPRHQLAFARDEAGAARHEPVGRGQGVLPRLEPGHDGTRGRGLRAPPQVRRRLRVHPPGVEQQPRPVGAGRAL
jgi:hypothetical protein